MYPTLFEFFGWPVGSYGVSKALAAIVAALLLGGEFRRLGWNPEAATNLVMVSTLLGFVGAKLCYLGEHARSLSAHDFGGSGFTWYGGLLAEDDADQRHRPSHTGLRGAGGVCHRRSALVCAASVGALGRHRHLRDPVRYCTPPR